MIGRPPHNRRLVIGTAGLTTARPAQLPRYATAGEALDPLRDELAQIMLESGYLEGAPFWWVNMTILLGLKDDDKPHLMRIDKKYGDLPLEIEVDTHRILEAANREKAKPVYDVEQLRHIFKVAALKALIHAGEKYGRPIKALQDELTRTVM